MKKIINGKLYNTDTARYVNVWSNNYSYSDFKYVTQKLYCKRNGEYFLHGEGGAMSRYAQQVGNNNWCEGQSIIPLTYDNARQWAEEKLTADEYEQEFGAVSDDDDQQTITLSLTVGTVAKAKRTAQIKGLSLSAYIASLIDAQ